VQPSCHKIFCASALLIVLLLVFQSCEKKSDAIIDSAVNPPRMLSATITPSVINTDTINIGPVRNPDDVLDLHIVAYATAASPTGASGIKSVFFTVLDESSQANLAEGELKNDGLGPDISANDSTYSGTIDLQIRRIDVGRFNVTMWSEDESGNQSNAILQPLDIERLNHSPVLSGLKLDTLIALEGDDHHLVIQISAADADGQADIQKVFFNSFLPSGSPSRDNPFLMFDDGGTVDHNGYTSGDAVAGDGVYTLTVLLPRTTTPGNYRFEFHAVDRSLAQSNVIIQTVQVTN
jgi:hypothetical protein